MAGRARLDDVLSVVAESLSKPGDVDQTLGRITQTAELEVPGVDYASVSIRHPNGRLQTLVPTNSLMYQADGLQYELNEGPCYDALTDETFISCGDLASDPRWPRFGPGASAMGLLSEVAFRLARHDESYTVLNLYAHARGAFDDRRGVARAFCSQAKVALGFAQEVRALHDALISRTVIAQATGMVMERHGIEAEHALQLLIHMAQTSSLPLGDVAERVVKPATINQIGTS